MYNYIFMCVVRYLKRSFVIKLNVCTLLFLLQLLLYFCRFSSTLKKNMKKIHSLLNNKDDSKVIKINERNTKHFQRSIKSLKFRFLNIFFNNATNIILNMMGSVQEWQSF